MNIKGWEYRSLTDLAQYINGYAFKPDDWEKEGLPIIRIEQLKNPESICDYYSGKIPDFNIIDNGDLIFSWSASLFLRFWNNGRAALNQHLFKVEAYENIDKYFLKSFIEFYLPEITKASHGSTMQHITRKELYRFGALVPIDKKEQEKIAEVLSTIDRAIAQTEAIIAKQQRIKTGLMQDLLTKGIDENGNIRSEATHEFKDSAIGRIPTDWKVTSLGEVVNKYGGKLQTGPFGSQLHSYEYVDNGIPVVMPQDINNSGISTSEIVHITEGKAKDLGRHRMIADDLVFARRGDLSRCAVIQTHQKGWICGTGCLLLRVPSGVLSSQWACEMYRYHTVQVQVGVQAVGSTMVNLNTGILANLLIPLPKYEEQQQIEKRFQALEKDYTNLLARKEKLNVVKTGLMQDLLTGKVRVTKLLNQKTAAN